jgi:hypothetical protein
MDGNLSAEGFVKFRSRTSRYLVRCVNGVRENGERYIDAAWTVQKSIILSIDGPEKYGAQITSSSFSLSLVTLLESEALSDTEVRHLIGWQALLLVDLLQRGCVTVRYAERVLFNLDVVRRLEQRHLQDCVELIDWGCNLKIGKSTHQRNGKTL